MKYFAKWLPVKEHFHYEGAIIREISTGNIGIIKKVGEGIDETEFEHIKLFLCSTDIQVGDNMLLPPDYKLLADGNYKDVVGCSSISEKVYHFTAPCIFGGTVHGGIFKSDKPIKIIGEISPDAIWVKEGDKFEEGDIKRDVLVKEYDGEDESWEYTHYHPKGNDIFKIGKYEKLICENPIKIKCSTCKTFH